MACITRSLFKLLVVLATYAIMAAARNASVDQCVENEGEPGYHCDFLLPTTSQFVARYQDANDRGKAVPANPVWFYTNLPAILGTTKDAALKCVAWLEFNGVASYYSVFDGINTDWMKIQREFLEENADFFENENPVTDPLNTFWLCHNQAAALATQNADAYLFTTRGEDWKPRSVWAAVEYWALTNNPNVQNIWRVDPTCGPRELLWGRARGDKALPSVYTCPIV